MENETPTSTNDKKGMSPMLIAGIVVLVLILAGAAFLMTKKSAQAPSTTAIPSETPSTAPTKAVMQKTETTAAPSGAMKENAAVKSFDIEGSDFKFVPNTLKVKMGDTVKITFKNTQGIHNFRIDEFNAKSKTIKANETDELTFVANKKGAFEYYCGVGSHKGLGMVGTLTVN